MVDCIKCLYCEDIKIAEKEVQHICTIDDFIVTELTRQESCSFFVEYKRG